MRALKVVEQIVEPEIAEAESWDGRLQMALLAPNGIQKLRELILELAMRGKLVPQNKSDGTFQQALEKIKRQCKKHKPLPPISESEKIFTLPEGWEWVRLGAIGDWGSGATPKRSKPEYYGGEIPWFKSGELTADYINSSEEKITELALKECSLRQNKKGDVLLAMYGATIGKTSILSIDGTTNQAVCACTPHEGIYNRFLLFLLKSLKKNFVGQGAGGAQPNISREKIIATVIAMPPLNEQKRIIDKIDELMNLCDKLEAQKTDAVTAHETLVKTLLGTLTQSQSAKEFQDNWRRIVKNFNILFTTETSIDALKKNILQLAVMGKLVPQSSKDESADKLLELIKIEKNKSGKAEKNTNKRSNFVAKETDDTFDIPQNWTWTTLSEISTLITDGEHLTPERTPDTTQIPLATAKNVRDGYLDLSNTDFVPKSVAQKCWKRCKPEKGDILVVSVGATTGRLSVCRESIDMVIVRSVTIIRPCLVDVDFLALTLNTPHLQKLIWKGVKQNAQPCLYLSASKNLSIPLPPLAEQKRIVCKVKELMDFCDNLKDGLIKFNTAHEHLATALVEKAVAA